MAMTSYAKRLTAQLYYKKGCHFVAAAILLDQNDGDLYVVLQLLCQGLEIMAKALLLLKNFDKYQPLVEKYRHRLYPLVSDALAEFKLNRLRPHTSAELENLSKMYSGHVFRYNRLACVLIDPKSISFKLTLRRTGAGIRLADREMRRAFAE